MSETLIIAIVGQIATILTIVLQQILSSRNVKIQIKLEIKKEYYKEKCKAYKLLISTLNIDFIENKTELNIKDLDFFYKDVFLYVSENISTAFHLFYNIYFELATNKKSLSQEQIQEDYRLLGMYASQVRNLARKEFEDM